MKRNSSLVRTLENLERHHHCCLIFQSREEQFAAVIPFLRLGVARGEKCIWLVNERARLAVTEAVGQEGTDLAAALGSGGLEVLSPEAARLRPPGGRPSPILAPLEAALKAALAAGFSGLRTTVEVADLCPKKVGAEWLSPHESRLGAFLKRNPCLTMCQYHRRHFPAEVLLRVIRTHPFVIHRGMLWQNFYYVPPGEFLRPDRAAREVDRLLSNIRKRGRVEAALCRVRDELEARVRQRTEQLARANQALRAEIAEHSRALAALQASEQRYQHLFDSVNDIIFTADLHGNVTSLSRAVERTLGYSPGQLLGPGVRALFPPEAIARLFQMLRAKLGGLECTTYELPMAAQDGRQVILELSTRLLFQEGKPVGVIGVGRDVTERKRTEEVLRESRAALERTSEQLRALAGSLLAAQEEERRHLSRELHDDLNQKLAMLAIEAEALEQELPPSEDGVRLRLGRLRRGVNALSDDVRRVAYQLHPSLLDHLGLAVALRSYCREFSQHHGLKVKFLLRRPVQGAPQEVSLCLYRVTQEALRNVAKHSKSARATVVLSGSPRGLHLSITDYGVGFDPEAVENRGGLGLVSMEERVRLVGGDFLIRSSPHGGTRLDVRIPVTSEVA